MLISRRKIARPAGSGGDRDESNCVKISQMTYIDPSNPSTNYYGVSQGLAEIKHDVSIYKRLIVKFDREITAKDQFTFIGDLSAYVFVEKWQLNPPGSSALFYCDVEGISNWGGLDINTINWDNFGALTTFSLAGGIQYAFSEITDASGDPPGGSDCFGSGTDSNRASHLNKAGGLYVDMGGTPKTFSGLMWAPGLNWSNVFIGGGGGIYGSLAMAKPTVKGSQNWDCAAIYNPG